MKLGQKTHVGSFSQIEIYKKRRENTNWLNFMPLLIHECRYELCVCDSFIGKSIKTLVSMPQRYIVLETKQLLT